MSSLRKRYSTASEPKPPSVAEELPSVEQPGTKPSAADEAAQSAIVQRLAEVEQAQRHQREPEPLPLAEPAQVEEEPRAPTAEQIIEASGMAPPVKNWLRKHPELVLDPVQNERLQKMHFVAEYQTGEVDTPAYLDRLDVLLGYRPQPALQPRTAPAPTYSRASGDEPRPAPVRQQRQSAPVSAPPTREVPSMGSGRPANVRRPLTPQQREAAAFAGVSEQEYEVQLRKMEAMKAAGQLQPDHG